MRSCSRQHGRCLLALGGILSLASLWPVSRLTAQEPKPADRGREVHLLYPPDGARVGVGAVPILLVAPADLSQPALLLDGKPLKAERLPFGRTWAGRKLKAAAPPPATSGTPTSKPRTINPTAQALWVAAAPLTAGPHRLQAGASQARLVASPDARDPKAPDGPNLLRVHQPLTAGPIGRTCDKCHEREEGAAGQAKALGLARTPKACAPCHPEDQVALVHRHVVGPLSRCGTCHDAHASLRPSLLVDAKEKLCTRCHEAGHFKS